MFHRAGVHKKLPIDKIYFQFLLCTLTQSSLMSAELNLTKYMTLGIMLMLVHFLKCMLYELKYFFSDFSLSALKQT